MGQASPEPACPEEEEAARRHDRDQKEGRHTARPHNFHTLTHTLAKKPERNTDQQVRVQQSTYGQVCHKRARTRGDRFAHTTALRPHSFGDQTCRVCHACRTS